MELKQFSEYSKEEQVGLLRHWWFYYGKLLVNLTDIEAFDKLVQEDPEFVKNTAVVAFVNGQSSQALVGAVRTGRVEELRGIINNIVGSADYKKISGVVEADFMKEVVGTFNQPQPPVSMTEEQIVQSVAAMHGVNPSNVEVITISGKDLEKGPQMTKKRKTRHEKGKK